MLMEIEKYEVQLTETDFTEFLKIKELISSSEKLQDYLDYLHIKEIKNKKEKIYSLDEAKAMLEL